MQLFPETFHLFHKGSAGQCSDTDSVARSYQPFQFTNAKQNNFPELQQMWTNALLLLGIDTVNLTIAVTTHPSSQMRGRKMVTFNKGGNALHWFLTIEPNVALLLKELTDSC